MVDIIITALVALEVGLAAFGRGRARRNWSIIKQYRPIHFLANLPVILLVLVVAALLTLFVPYFDKNPFSLLLSWIFDYGNGNGGANVALVGLQWKWYAVCFLPVFLFAIPSLAAFEEEKFRKGTTNWKNGAVRSVGFGLIHTLALIPFGAACALTIGGLWFTRQYFKGGTNRSTVYHAAYNSMIGSLLLVEVIVNW